MLVPASYADWRVNLVCYDRKGKALATNYGSPLSGQRDGATGGESWMFTYPEKAAKEMRTWELSVRPYEHVTLSGIHIRPNATP